MNPSIDALKASDGSGNASVATIQNARSPLATTIQVDTVAGINDNFVATMGTPHTFIDPVTSEEITVVSEETAIDFRGHVDGSDLEIDEIAPGYTDNGSEVGDIVIIRPNTQWADLVAEVLEVSHNDDGTLKVADAGSIKDANGNEQIKFSQTTSAVNEVTIKNAATGNRPELQATGGDTNIGLNLVPKGTGEVAIGGTPMSGAWQDWTPTYTNITVGNGTVVAKYKQIGKTVHFIWILTAGSTSSISNANRITLPVTPASHLQVANLYPAIGVMSALDVSAGTYFIGTVFIDQNNSRIGVNVHNPTSTAMGESSSTFPVNEASGDTYTLSATYEAA